MENYFAFARSHVGFSHISSQKPCQDYSLTFDDDETTVIVVSDGHGSDNFPRSDRGSRIACEVAINSAREFLKDLNVADIDDEYLRDEIVRQLCKHILFRWNILVAQDAEVNPFSESEVEKVSDKYKGGYLSGEEVGHAYGSTLILVIVTHEFCLAIRNGDGQCVVVDNDGNFATPIPWNDKCEFNATTSICDSEAIDDFNYYYTKDIPAAVFIGSDGVDDSYTSIEELYNLYRKICKKVIDDGPDVATEYVEKFLPELTKQGSFDDVSIAGIVNPIALENVRTSIEIAIESYKMRLVEVQQQKQKNILIRDIKYAEKKKVKAIERQRELISKLKDYKENQTGLLKQISIFQKKADACGEGMTSLAEELKQLTEIIDNTDAEIVRLNGELNALENRNEDLGSLEFETSANDELVLDKGDAEVVLMNENSKETTETFDSVNE